MIDLIAGSAAALKVGAGAAVATGAGAATMPTAALVILGVSSVGIFAGTVVLVGLVGSIAFSKIRGF